MLTLERPLLTVPQVAERLQMTEVGVRRYLRLGELKGFRLGGDRVGWRVTEEELARFIAKRQGRDAPEVGPDGESRVEE